MKILFDATPLALTSYHKGGAYRYGVEVLRRLPGLLPDGWSLELYFNFFRRAHLARMHEAIERVGVAAHRVSRVHPKLLRALRVPAEWTAGKHDLFHGAFDNVPPTRHSTRVVTIQDLAFLRAPEGLPAEWVKVLSKQVPAAARRAHRVLTGSEFSRQDMVQRLGIDPAKIEVIPYGIPDGYAPPHDRDADLVRLRERYGIEAGFLLYLGTLQPNKNIERLCEAFQLLRARGFAGQLVLAGAKGWLYDEMWARIVARGHADGVLQTGFVDDEDIPRLYGNCAAFALVSLLEGFGIPVIEAMACGAPVVVADACSLPEVAGGAGLLVDPLDPQAIAAALEKAAAPGERRQQRIDAGIAHAARFTWEASAAGLVQAYRKAQESRA